VWSTLAVAVVIGTPSASLGRRIECFAPFWHDAVPEQKHGCAGYF
jgi:hypothetical protein